MAGPVEIRNCARNTGLQRPQEHSRFHSLAVPIRSYTPSICLVSLQVVSMSKISVLLGSPPARPDMAKLRNSDLAPSANNLSFQHSPRLSSHSQKPHSENSIPGKPKPFVYSLSTLLEIPSRLTHPPSVKSSHGNRWTRECPFSNNFLFDALLSESSPLAPGDRFYLSSCASLL